MKTQLFICTLIPILVVLASACDTGGPRNSQALKEEMAAHEVKRITAAEIMIKGEEIGETAVGRAQSKLQQELLAAIGEKGVKEAISYCNIHAYPLVKDLEDSLGISIRRVSQKWRNPANRPDSIENEMLTAYAYQSNVDGIGGAIQELDDQTLIYTQPITIKGLCLNCHGKPGETVLKENYVHIRKLYPEDQAVGYQLGDLRGMWSVKIPKKGVIDRL